MAGSLGYAERLSWRDDLGGQLGDPELAETSVEVVSTKVDELAELIRESKASGGMVVHTGAGISTSTAGLYSCGCTAVARSCPVACTHLVSSSPEPAT
jgi:hypothetical protein